MENNSQDKNLSKSLNYALQKTHNTNAKFSANFINYILNITMGMSKVERTLYFRFQWALIKGTLKLSASKATSKNI